MRTSKPSFLVFSKLIRAFAFAWMFAHINVQYFVLCIVSDIKECQGLPFTGWQGWNIVCVYVSVCVTKGVKIPYRSKINPLSHGLTFTESWSVGVREGVALLVCTHARCAYACVCVCLYEVSLGWREKLHWCKMVLLFPCQVRLRVRRKLWDFPQV